VTPLLLRGVRVSPEHATVIVSCTDGRKSRKSRTGGFRIVDASWRDTKVLTWIGEMRGVPYQVVPWLLGRWSPLEGQGVVGERTARRWLERVERRGLVERVKVLGDPWVLLTQHGGRLMGTGWSRYGVPRSRADHTAGKALVRFWLEEVEPGGRWVSEGRLFSEGGREWHRPDAAWLMPGSEASEVAIEVELSRKASFRHGYADIMERMPPWAERVWWFAPRADVAWLAARLAGSSVPFEVRELPTLDWQTHPASCRCVVCRVAALEGLPGAVGKAAGLPDLAARVGAELAEVEPLDMSSIFGPQGGKITRVPGHYTASGDTEGEGR
jgi:hypothetical protein